MPKIRIHELAKELGKSNKEVSDFLLSKKVEIKSHMSALDVGQEDMVRKHFKANEHLNTEEVQKKSAEAQEKEKRAIEKKKKSNIIAVVRPQNARSQEARKKLQQREKVTREKAAIEKATALKAEKDKVIKDQETKEKERRDRLAKEAQEKVDAQAKALHDAKERDEQAKRLKVQADKDAAASKAKETTETNTTTVNADKETKVNKTMEKPVLKENDTELNTDQQEQIKGHVQQPQQPQHAQADRQSRPQHTQGDRPRQSHPHTDRPNQGQNRSYGDRQGQGQNRPYGDRQGQGQNRPYGDRQGQGQNRPYGDRQGQGQNRPYGDRQGQGQNRPYGDRQGQGQNRPYGDRQGQGQNRPYGDRQGQGQNRPYGDRQGQGQNRPYGDRQGQGQNRPYGDRQGQGQNRPYGDRQGQGQNRPYGDRQGQGQNRPYGDRQGQGQGRPYGDRQGQGRPYGDRQDRGPGSFNRDKKPASDTIDLGIKKPSRDTSHKVKDKTKDSLRGEKRFGDDKRPNQHNRGGQNRFSNIPKALKKPAPKPKEEKKEVVTEISLPEKMTIRELADKMKMQPSVIVKKLFLDGIMVTVNHEIDFDKAQEIALGYDIIAEPEIKVDVIEELLKEEDEDQTDMVPRPPVVVVMGHVDHGKTSLLDAIRHTHVTDREAGGITQHIGATVVSINNQKITFLDTPGHEAFTAMRMRGANSTDIAILVVAADDGVMPQTIEAINHAKAAKVEIIVAVNKIDKPGANVERVKQELSEYELVPEDWGGSTIFVPVSAKTNEGIKDLLEMILLTAEVLELKANPKRKARGLVLEARLDKGKGPVANILVQKGTLYVGDYIAAGACSGKVRAMIDEKGRNLKEAGPSTPVELLGLGDVPNAGEVLVATDTDKEAKNFAATFVSEGKSKLIEDTKAKMSLDDLFSQIKEGNLKELNIVVKADVQGSVEAMKQSLQKLSNEEVVVKIVHGGVGAINESDVILAAASQAIIIGFNVRPDAQAKVIAEQEGIDVRLYRVIYQAIDDVEAAMKGMLDPVFEEKIIGHAEIRQLFKASGVGTIAGSYVLDGMFQRGCKVRITREGKQIFEGELGSLKRFKDDVKEVKAGYECGLVFEDYNDEQELDVVEAYIMVEVPR